MQEKRPPQLERGGERPKICGKNSRSGVGRGETFSCYLWSGRRWCGRVGGRQQPGSPGSWWNVVSLGLGNQGGGMNEGRVVVVLRGKPECHSGLNFWDAWNLITSNWLTWGHRWAHQHWAHSQPPVQSPPCSVAGTARTLKFLIIVYFHHIATKIAIQRARKWSPILGEVFT